jgi:hypothetical protein
MKFHEISYSKMQLYKHFKNDISRMHLENVTYFGGAAAESFQIPVNRCFKGRQGSDCLVYPHDTEYVCM